MHRIDPNAASRQVGDAVGRGEARLRDDAKELLVGELGLGRFHQPALARSRQHLLAVDAAAVVRDADRHRRAVTQCAQGQSPRLRLPLGFALVGGLDAVVDRVAQQMHDRVADLVEHRPVELDLFALDRELHWLANRSRSVSDQAREAVEPLPHGHHAAGHDLVLQVGDEPRGLRHRLRQSRVVDAAGQLHEATAGDHQLADQVHQVVEAAQVDAHAALLPHRARSAAARRPIRRLRHAGELRFLHHLHRRVVAGTHLVHVARSTQRRHDVVLAELRRQAKGEVVVELVRL